MAAVDVLLSSLPVRTWRKQAVVVKKVDPKSFADRQAGVMHVAGYFWSNATRILLLV
jgi:hypothetical protein